MKNGGPPPVPSKSPAKHWSLGVGPILSHSFNSDRTLLAVSSAEKIFILALENGIWVPVNELDQHDLHVSGIDWAPKTNRIVSCSHDKNSFVWTVGPNNSYKPEMVIVRSQRGLSCVKWSPLENKFAIGTNAKHLTVCFYDENNNWWIEKQIKKSIQSSVLCVDWHPNNVILAVGTADFRVLVFSAYIKEVDEKPGPTPWGAKLPFGALLAEYSTIGWVHSVSFSPSGNQLAWTTHASEVGVVNKTSGGDSESPGNVINHTMLPFKNLLWVDESSFIGIGHEYSPVLFEVENGMPVLRRKIGIPAAEKETTNSAFKMFRNIDRTAATQGNDENRPKSLHQNAVTGLRAYASGPKGISKFSTCSLDGMIVLWDLKAALEATENTISGEGSDS